MASTIQNLKSALGSGGRVNKYSVALNIPSAVSTTSDLSQGDILCKAASFPGVTVGAIEVFNQGRKLLIPGDTTYTNTWELTFYNTEDHGLRKDFLSWMRSADHFQNNSHSGSPSDLMTDLAVSQLDSAGNITATYTFHNVWVSDVGEIALADDTDGGIQEFPVTFTFTDWVVGTGELNVPSDGNAATGNAVAE